jgi:divalent metal cation (Fe/Co/Zn/Cd) transporter
MRRGLAACVLLPIGAWVGCAGAYQVARGNPWGLAIVAFGVGLMVLW